MEIEKNETVKVEAKTVQVHCKVCDSGIYTLLDAAGKEVKELEGEYVPSFFPGEHYGDYLILDIDLESGKILNWKKPDAEEVSKVFKLIVED